MSAVSRRVFLVLAACCTMLGAQATLAEAWPTKPVKMVVGFAPGGGTDVVARVLAQRLTEMWGQQVIVENRPGATGVIGADSVAKAAPDGYTLLMGHVNSNAIAPNFFRKLPFDPIKDFIPVIYVGYVPNVLVVHPSVQAKSVEELIALAKSTPGQLTYASSGNGSTQHLAGEKFKVITGVDIVHVPYKGSGQALGDLLGGQVNMNFDTMPPILEPVKSKRLRALAVSTPQRVPQMPDVPTFAEVGMTGFDVTNWYGVFAPAGTPRDIVMKVNADILKAMQNPETRAKLEQVGTQLGGGTPEEFAVFVKSEIAKYAKLVKEANVKQE